jgi:hypothetical protein
VGRVFNSKLGCIAALGSVTTHAATSKVENSAPGSSCKLKFVHAYTALFVSCVDEMPVGQMLFDQKARYPFSPSIVFSLRKRFFLEKLIDLASTREL